MSTFSNSSISQILIEKGTQLVSMNDNEIW